MRQVKRFIYFVLLNIIISAITVYVVLQVWQRNHPTPSGDSTPAVLVITQTQSVNLPLLTNSSGGGEILPADAEETTTGYDQLTPTPEMVSYRVKEGDTLIALAVQFNTTVDDIMMVNGLADANSITVGQILLIPTGPIATATHTTLPPTAASSPTRPQATATSQPVASSTPTANGQESQMIIEAVFGMGVLSTEHVELLRTGEGELSLAGWTLEDGEGNNYVFPMLTLYKGGTINIYTRSGQDTVIDLYWGLQAPIWRSGKTVSLYDAEHTLRASYAIP